MKACHATSDTSSASTLLLKKVLAAALVGRQVLVNVFSKCCLPRSLSQQRLPRSSLPFTSDASPVNTAPCSPAVGWGWYVCVLYVCVDVFVVIRELGTGLVSTTHKRGWHFSRQYHRADEILGKGETCINICDY